MEIESSALDWTAAIDAVVRDVLKAAGLNGPPVEPFSLARRFGVDIALDASQATRGRFKRLAGQPAIFLKPDERPERLHWAAAHELGELLAWRVAKAAGASAEDLPGGVREQLANSFASRLLLPTDWFQMDIVQLDRDLPALKACYSTASHELIAWRFLDFERPMWVTLFDQGKLIRRRSGRPRATCRLHPLEQQAQRRCHLTGASLTVRSEGICVQAWPIHEPGWKREILCTTSPEEGDVPGELSAEGREPDFPWAIRTEWSGEE